MAGFLPVDGFAVDEIVFYDADDGADAVLPADFFSFIVAAWVVGDGGFHDAELHFGELGGDFWLEAEAVFFDGDGLDDFAAESFVAGFHVGDVEVAGHVREESEEAVAHGVPEAKDGAGVFF